MNFQSISVIGFALLSAVVVNGFLPPKQYVRGCYYTNWSQYRLGVWKFMPDKIEAGLCSHLFFAFASMGEDFKLRPTEPNDEDIVDHGKLVPGLYSQVNAIKKLQPDLKTLLSFGGFLFSQANAPLMRKMLGDAKNRKTFIDSIIVFVRRAGFDGFDFNWFPSNDTKADFNILVKELRDAIEIDSKAIAKPRLLLTAAVPGIIDRIEAGYDGKVLAESLDFMNIMTFDYHGSWDNVTGFNSPQYDRDGDDVSINSTMTYLSEHQHVPKEKLIVGFPTYGRGWTLNISSEPNSVGSPAIGPSPAQIFTRAEGVAAYFEICELIESRNYTEQFDRIQQVPFIFEEKVNDGRHGRVWISYNNEKSYDVTIDWLKLNGYGGGFVWALDMDDFLGHCRSSKGKYPLVSVLKEKLKQ